MLLSCLVLIPSTDETEAASVIEITDVSVKQDADWSDLHSYTDIQTLKDNFTVTAKVDGQSRQLTTDEFYLSIGGPLVDGDNTFTVVAYTQDGQDLVEEFYTMADPVSLNVDESYRLESLTVTPPAAGQVFPSSTDAEFKSLDGFKVTANYMNSSGEIVSTDVKDFTIDCNYNNTSEDGIPVTIGYGDKHPTFDYVITPLEPEEITKLEQIGTIRSGNNSNSNSVKDAIRVEVSMNDGKTHTSDEVEFEYTVSGNLYTGLNADDTTKKLTATLPNGDEMSESFTVTPSVPMTINTSVIDTTFHAFQEPDVTVSVVFSPGGSFRDNVSEGLNFYFYPKGVKHEEYKQPTAGDGHIENITDPEYGLKASDDSYILVITYTEGTTIVSENIEVKVVKTEIPYPYINSSTPSYINDYIEWTIDDYNPALDYTITATPVVEHPAEIVDGKLRAIDVAEYEVSFSIPDDLKDSYEWDDTRAVTTYTVEITKGVAVIGIDEESVQDWVFGDTSKKPEFTATLRGADASKADVTDQIDWDRVTVQYMNATGEIKGIDHAGDWQVRVIVGEDATDNLTVEPSAWFGFTVSPDTLTASVTGSYTYNGEVQHPTVVVTGRFQHDEIGYICETAQENAGTYDVTITLTNTTDFVWANPETDYPSTTVLEDAWTIAKLGVAKPTIEGATDSGIETTYNATEQSWAVTEYDGSYIGFESTCSLDGTPYDGATVSGSQITVRDAGTYTVTFSMESQNHQWNDGTTGDVTFTIDVGKADLTLEVSVDPITYGDLAPVDSAYELTFSWQGTDNSTQITGDSFRVYTDYVRTDDERGDAGSYPI